jgi:hypothetical protein
MRPTVPRAARLVPAAYALFVGLNGHAAPDPPEDSRAARLAPAFHGTVRATYPDGRYQRLWLKPDGHWTGRGRGGSPSAGKWSLKADRLCLHRTRPFPVPMKYCTPLPDDLHVGAAWPAKDLRGRSITLSVHAGGRSGDVQPEHGKTP